MKVLKNIILSMRPEQWIKNLIIFAGLFFGKSLNNISTLLSLGRIFLIFCFISSGSYIINDLIDKKEDRHHPEKAKRPIASGALGLAPALTVAIMLIFAGLIWSYPISYKLLILLTVFLSLHILYDLFLKHIAIVDVFAIAFAFILRLLGGVVTSPIGNIVSSWILLCTFLLALFLAMCKRRAEIAMLMEESHHHRKSLTDYNIGFLDQLITIAGGGAILSYSLYALSPDTIAKHGTDKLIYTIPFVAYGIFRYLYLVHIRKAGCNPEKIFTRDIPFLVNMLLYCGAVYLIIYRV